MNKPNELKKNKFKIRSNPYQRKIEYFLWDDKAIDGPWIKPADTSPFLKPEFTEAALYHKAYDIIENTINAYGGNVGLEIEFEGTADEYNTLNTIIDDYFEDKEIEIKKGKEFLLPVKEVKNNIEEAFSAMENDFKNYPSNAASDTIKKYNDTMSHCIPVCVMGLYSTGKSAFINSLLGVEILPSADDPTTAKTFKITIGPSVDADSIKFKYQDENTPETKIKIEFSGKKFSFNKGTEIEIISKLNEVDKIIEEKQKSAEINTKISEHLRMYHALSIINEFDREYIRNKKEDNLPWRVSPLVEVSLRLNEKYTVLPIDKYDFIIYDTPGSNSATNKEDKKVLNDAMRGQTNGLPIYVITSKNMDTADNTELIDTLKKLGDALDRNNLMIAVNQADDIEVSTLVGKKEKFPHCAMAKLNPAGTYFVSSVMGLGSKLLMTERYTKTQIKVLNHKIDTNKPDFIDPHYWELFGKNMSDFSDPTDAKSLYKYNIIPKSEYDKYIEIVNEKSKKQNNDDVLIFYNSGLHSIGSAITDFAENYSLYNKCRSAGIYLSEALNQVIDQINKKEEEKQNAKSEMFNSLDKEKKALKEELDNKIKEIRKECEISSVNILTKPYKDNAAKLIKDIPDEVKSIKDDISIFDFKKPQIFATKMSNYLNKNLTDQFKTFKATAETLFYTTQDSLKKSLINIIINSPTLTEETKNILKSTIKNINVTADFKWNCNISPEGIASGHLWLTIKEQNLIDNCKKIFESETTRSISAIKKQWFEAYDKMGTKYLDEAIPCLDKHNPKIQKINKDINKCNKEIEYYINQKNNIEKKAEKIKELTEFKKEERHDE